jgi:hypothetical protein
MDGLGKPIIDTNAKYEKGPHTGTYFDNTAWYQDFSTDKVATGVHGMGGSWLDRIGLKTSDGSVL